MFTILLQAVRVGTEEEGDSPFLGFGEREIDESTELKSKFQMRRIKGLEEMVDSLMLRVTALEKERSIWEVQKEEFNREWSVQTMKLEKELREVNKEKEKLREENESLKKQMEKEIMEVVNCREDIQSTVQNVERKQPEWVKI